jgi:hypothetical protein
MSSKIFFSYSRFDSPFALQLASDLREAGANIWIDQIDIPAGNHWDAAVEKALDNSATVLVILSPTSIVSPNVMDEVSFALESGKKIIPVMFVDCLTPFRLRRLQRVDFTREYSAGLNQLLHSLGLKTHDELVRKEQPSKSANKAYATTFEDEGPDRSEWEDALWEGACSANTIDAYKKYLSESVTGTFKAEAKLLIKQMEVEQKEDELEAMLWQKVKMNNAIDLYKDYLKDYPQGNYKTLALAAITDLEKKEKAEKNKPLLHSQQKRPFIQLRQSLIMAAAGFILLTLIISFILPDTAGNDESDWAKALGENNLAGFVNYQKTHPSGVHFSEAQHRFDSLFSSTIQIKSVPEPEKPVAEIDTMLTIVVPDSNDTLRLTAITKPKTPSLPKSTARFKAGQIHEGGVIIYVDNTGEHGLIAAMKDEGSFSWEAAAKKCSAFKAAGYDDWHLPTKEELKRLYTARKYLGRYAKGFYWSSEAENKSTAWAHNFNNGFQGISNKNSLIAVRPVRNF